MKTVSAAIPVAISFNTTCAPSKFITVNDSSSHVAVNLSIYLCKILVVYHAYILTFDKMLEYMTCATMHGQQEIPFAPSSGTEQMVLLVYDDVTESVKSFL